MSKSRSISHFEEQKNRISADDDPDAFPVKLRLLATLGTATIEQLHAVAKFKLPLLLVFLVFLLLLFGSRLFLVWVQCHIFFIQLFTETPSSYPQWAIVCNA